MSEKVKVRGTSSAPMVLGIIGGVLDLPAAVCGAACAGGMVGIADETGTGELAASAAGGTMAMGIAAGVLAIVFGCMAKRNPKLAGICMMVSAILNLAVVVMSMNFMAIISLILILIGSIISFTQKKETVE